VRGCETKTLVLLAIALMLANTPCLAACIACSARPAVPSCHHQAPSHEDNKQPCPHQLFRAMAPSMRSAYSPIYPDAQWSEVETTAAPPDALVVPLGPVMGLSPPRSGITHTLVLRV
jgi:iron only hydrogenase large subunit-like protein